MITTTAGVVAAVGAVAGARILKANALADIRWWAIPLICLLGLAGMPMAISISLYPSLCKAAGGVYLAPWITDLWRSTGYLLGLGWVVAVAVVYFGRGVRFACPARQRLLLIVPVVLLCLSSLFDTLLFFGLRRFDTSHIAVESISPDGSRRVLCDEDNWLDTSFAFIVTANVKRPLTCTRLDGFCLDDDLGGERRISWSADSQIMCLWVGNEPVCLYDFANCELNRPDVSWETPTHVTKRKPWQRPSFRRRCLQRLPNMAAWLKKKGILTKTLHRTA